MKKIVIFVLTTLMLITSLFFVGCDKVEKGIFKGDYVQVSNAKVLNYFDEEGNVKEQYGNQGNFIGNIVSNHKSSGNGVQANFETSFKQNVQDERYVDLNGKWKGSGNYKGIFKDGKYQYIMDSEVSSKKKTNSYFSYCDGQYVYEDVNRIVTKEIYKEKFLTDEPYSDGLYFLHTFRNLGTDCYFDFKLFQFNTSCSDWNQFFDMLKNEMSVERLSPKFYLDKGDEYYKVKACYGYDEYLDNGYGREIEISQYFVFTKDYKLIAYKEYVESTVYQSIRAETIMVTAKGDKIGNITFSLSYEPWSGSITPPSNLDTYPLAKEEN